MKKILMMLLFSTGFFFTKAQSKEEARIASSVEKMRLAMISGNRGDLESIAADKLHYWHSSGKLEDKTAFVETIASKKSDFVTIELKDQTITISGNTALVHHNLLADTNDGGKPGKVNLGILLVWQKQGREWKLLARQAYKLN